MRTKEEKLKLIEDYKASGLSMNKWCIENSIATSTMSTWLAKTNNNNKKTKNNNKKTKNKSKSNKKAKFVEVTTPIKNAIKADSIVTLEYKDFKISISDSLDVLLLKDILKVVTELNV